MSNNTLLLIDAHALIHRSYHAIERELTSPTGEPTKAVYGFASTLLKVIKDQEPEYVVATFDMGKSFRSDQYVEYKANRPSTPAAGIARPPADPIPLERAVWFIRVLGANEISAHRGRAQPTAAVTAAPSPVPATPSSTNTTAAAPPIPLSSNAWYTQEFTNTFTSWMRLQLVQLALPSKGKPGAPKPAIGILGDEKARARWIAKWDYT